MGNLIETFFELIGTIIKGSFGILQVLFGADPNFNKQSKYNSKFMGFWTSIKLLNSWNKGVRITGTKNITDENSRSHVLGIGGSGTGKTSTIVIPSILENKNSFVVTDVDGDIFRKTSGALMKKGFSIQVLNLADISKSVFYNPVANCKNNSDYKKLAELLIDTAYPNANSESTYWNMGAQTAIYILLRLLSNMSKNYQNLANVRFLLQRFDSIENFVAENASESVWNDYVGFCSADKKIQSGQISSALVALDKLSDEGVAFLTSKNTLDFSKLTQKKSALFIIVPEVKLGFYSFLLSIFYSQLFEYLQTNKPKKTLFCYLDEFSQLNIKDFPLLATTLRRYNVSLTLLIQDLQQLSAKYGQDGASAVFNGSCANKIIFPGMSYELARKLSDSFGRKGVSIQPSKESVMSDRELLTVQELIQLKDGKALFIFRNKPPLIMRMTPYFKQYFKQFAMRRKTKLKPLKLQENPITLPELISIKPKPIHNEETE